MIDRQRRELANTGLTTFLLKVRPHAQSTRFRGPLGNDIYKVDIAAPVEDGKANEELIRFMAEAFDVHRSHVEILSGWTGREKVVRVRKEEIDKKEEKE